MLRNFQLEKDFFRIQVHSTAVHIILHRCSYSGDFHLSPAARCKIQKCAPFDLPEGCTGRCDRFDDAGLSRNKNGRAQKEYVKI